CPDQPSARRVYPPAALLRNDWGPGGYRPAPRRGSAQTAQLSGQPVQPLERVLGRLVGAGVAGLLEEGDDVARAVRKGHLRIRRVQQRRRRMPHERLEATASQLERVEQAGRPPGTSQPKTASNDSPGV